VAANSKASGNTAPDGSVGPQTFRSMTAVVIWWVWVLFAVGNLIDLAVQGRDHLAVVAAVTLVLMTGVAYVTALRPRVIAADDGIRVQNPLRDHQIPWQLVRRVDLADLLRIHVGEPGAPDPVPGKRSKKINAWAVHYSRRRQLTSEMRARRANARMLRGGPSSTTVFGMPSPYNTPSRQSAASAAVASPEAEAERIARLLNDRATAAGIEQATEAARTETGEAETSEGTVTNPVVVTSTAVAGQGTGPLRMVSTWSWQAIAALGVPALVLLIVALV
jgi:Bacterial PH domain